MKNKGVNFTPLFKSITMKLKLLILTSLALILFGCKKKADTETSTDRTVVIGDENRETTKSSVELKDCDDFLNAYEAWGNKLINLMAQHKDDPIKLVTAPEYMNTMLESTDFLKQWETISFSCASDASYSQRMNAIQEKLVKKQKELGLIE